LPRPELALLRPPATSAIPPPSADKRTSGVPDVAVARNIVVFRAGAQRGLDAGELLASPRKVRLS
jgi:hypothetical protein